MTTVIPTPMTTVIPTPMTMVTPTAECVAGYRR